MSQSKYPYIEFSGALQQITTPHIRKQNEVESAQNADFTSVIGAFIRRAGAQKYDATNYPTIPDKPIDKPTLGAFIAQYSTGAELWMASNITADASASVRRYTGSAWVDVQTGYTASSEINFTYDLDEVWISAYLASTDTIGNPVTVDNTHSVSTSRLLNFAPQARFYLEFNGSMWAANCTVAGTRYRDRIYKSSGPTGVISSSRSAQTDVSATVTLVDQVPTMTSNTTPSGVVAASTQNTGSEAWRAFNDSTATTNDKWLTNAVATGTLSYDFTAGNPKIITYYSMTPVSSVEPSLYTRAPKTWTFEGSNNGTSWTVLDTQTTVPQWGADEKRIYPISNTTSFRFYRWNITANFGDTYMGMYEAELLQSTTGIKALTLNVDSARYLKPTQVIDIYQAGTNTLLYGAITILAVDKINDAITFLPYQLNFATTDVNTTTDVITLSATTSMPTGTPIRFTTTGGLPAPLVAGTSYYVINTGGTTIKVATNLINAQTGIAIDLTTTGSGTHTVLLSYIIGNRDELWATGRKGKLTRFWNTDYRNPEDADWLKLPATLDATNDITAVGKISSRFFIWTANSMFKYDGQNLTPLYNDIGCVAIKTVCYYMSFMVWLDSKGQIWARNEEAGTQDVISTPIQKTIALVAQSSLTGASAVCVGKKMKMTLGQVTQGQLTRTLRVVYDFEANTWTTEWFVPQMPVQIEYKYNGTIKPHFFDEHGSLWVDELDNDDNGVTIPLDVKIGPDNLQVDEIKSFNGVKIYGKNNIATKVLMQVDYGEWLEIGELRKPVDSLAVPKKVPNGTMVNLRFTNSSTGDPVEIHKAVIYYNTEEDTFRVSKR